MAIEKFKSAEAMNAAPVKASRGNGFDRFLRHCSRYWMIAPRVYPRGVMRFRSLEEAQEARAAMAKANARRLRRRESPG